MASAGPPTCVRTSSYALPACYAMMVRMPDLLQQTQFLKVTRVKLDSANLWMAARFLPEQFRVVRGQGQQPWRSPTFGFAADHGPALTSSMKCPFQVSRRS